MSQSYSIQFQAVVEAKCIFSLDFKLAVNWFSFHVNDTPKRRPYPLAAVTITNFRQSSSSSLFPKNSHTTRIQSKDFDNYTFKFIEIFGLNDDGAETI